MATYWTLKQGLEKKFAGGHPWVFSSDLAHSPKGIDAGAEIELRDANGNFLARGYGNSNTLIAFRTLTRDKSSEINPDFFFNRLKACALLRKQAGVFDWSHRLCFAEGDGIPGLVIDRYRLDPRYADNHAGQVFVVQSSTAGIDKQLPSVFRAIERLVEEEKSPTWARTAIVVANDSKSRLLEGIKPEAKAVLRPIEGVDFSSVPVLVQPGLPEMHATVFSVDFVTGQKTGFFLDQRSNVLFTSQVLASRLKANSHSEPRTLRILDLCCYVGQWSTQLTHLAKFHGVEAEATVVDSSAKALDLAIHNVERHGGKAIAVKMDIVEDLKQLPNASYDIVICDPPAFIKKKKDVATGRMAYVKVNREAMRKVAAGGIFFSSSCSGLLEESEFRGVLARAASQQRDRNFRWIYRGSHSPDHPQLPEFPQGTYLKSWLAIDLT